MFFLKFFTSVLFVCLLQNSFYAQENNGPPKKEQSIKSKRKLRKADKRKWKEERAAKRAEEKNIKAYHKRLQTKAVRKRMNQSKVKAQRNRDHLKEPLLLRFFNKKRKHKTSSQAKEKK